jgi:hypothetical protein
VGWTVTGLNPAQKDIFLVSESLRPGLEPTQPLVPLSSGQGVELNGHRLMPRLRMSGATPVLPLYPVMVWAGATLPSSNCWGSEKTNADITSRLFGVR